MAAALLFIPLACLGVGLLWLVWGPKKSSGPTTATDETYGVVMPPLPVRERAPLPERIEAPQPRNDAVPHDDSQSSEVQLDEETIRAINELSAHMEGFEIGASQPAPATAEGSALPVFEPVSAEERHEAHDFDDDTREVGHPLDGIFDEQSAQTYEDVVWDDAWVTAAMDEDDVSPELYGDLNDIFAERAADEPQAAGADASDANPVVPPPAVVMPSVELVSDPSARYRRRRSDKRVALAKFPYDPEVWDDPLSPGKRRRLEKRAELDRRRAEDLRERTYKRVEKARQKHADLESTAREEALKAATPEAAITQDVSAEFTDVWSRATLLEAPDKSGIEQPREREQRKNAKKAGRSKKRAAKAQARLEKLMERHEKRQELVAKREEANAVVAVAPEFDEDIKGVGVDGVQHADIVDSGEMRDFSENAVATEPVMTIEVLENLPAAEELVSGEELSEREQKRAEKKAERESRKLEKLAEREKRRGERADSAKPSKRSRKGANDDSAAGEPLEFEPGLGTDANSGAWDDAAITVAAGSAADDLARSQAELLESEPELMTATLWEKALGTEDGLQGAAVSSWEAAAQGITEFVDPTRGAHATDAEEWIVLGEDIEDTAEAEPGRGKDAIIESDEVEEDVSTSYDTIIEIGTGSVGGKKRRFARRKKDEEVEDDGGVSIGEWVSEGATLVTVTSDYVDHHSYDLPEPIPDRVQVAFGADE